MKLNLLYRVLLGVVFIPVILILFYLGNWYLMLFLTVVVLVQSLELRKMFALKNSHIPIFVLVLNLIFLVCFSLKEFFPALIVFLITIILIFLTELIKKRNDRIINTISATFFLMIYTSFLLSFVYYIRELEKGRLLLMSLMVLIWLTDTFAYFAGSYLGRKRNIVAASPGKSLEGFIGGFIGGAGGAYLCGLIFHLNFPEIIILGLTTGIFGQLGDLMESLIKRDFGVKDSSHILPGHGGMLDRFDSLAIAAPVFYVIFHILSI